MLVLFFDILIVLIYIELKRKNKFIFIFDFGIVCVIIRVFLLVFLKNGKRIFDDIFMFEL